MKPHILILFYGNGLAIWQSFPDIKHIKVNNHRKSAILNFFKLTFFRAYPSLKHYILFYSKGLAIWHGFPDITHIKASAILNFIELNCLGHIPPRSRI